MTPEGVEWHWHTRQWGMYEGQAVPAKVYESAEVTQAEKTYKGSLGSRRNN